jgi:hypothetical protein
MTNLRHSMIDTCSDISTKADKGRSSNVVVMMMMLPSVFRVPLVRFLDQTRSNANQTCAGGEQILEPFGCYEFVPYPVLRLCYEPPSCRVIRVIRSRSHSSQTTFTRCLLLDKGTLSALVGNGENQSARDVHPMPSQLLQYTGRTCCSSDDGRTHLIEPVRCSRPDICDFDVPWCVILKKKGQRLLIGWGQ